MNALTPGESAKALGEGRKFENGGMPEKALVCPAFEMSPEYMSNEKLIFSVKFKDGKPKSKLTYKWTVYRSGEIESGQNTPTVKIIKGNLNMGVITSVEIGGLEKGCANIVVIDMIH